MVSRKLLALAIPAGVVALWCWVVMPVLYPQPTPGFGSGVIACVGAPGNTGGGYRQICQTTAGALYACNNSSGCSVAGDWVAQGGSQVYPSGTGVVQVSSGTSWGTTLTPQGNGTKAQLSTGTTTTNDCVKYDANGNTVDSGSACGGAVTSVAGLTGAVPGGLVLLEQHTAANSTNLPFTTCFSSSYDSYVVDLINLRPATNTDLLYMRFSTNGGSSYDSSNSYAMSQFIFSSTGNVGGGQPPASPATQLGLASGASCCSGNSSNSLYGVTGHIDIHSPLSTSLHKRVESFTSTLDNEATPEMIATLVVGEYQSTSAGNAFALTFSTGNITSGTARCYGIAKQ